MPDKHIQKYLKKNSRRRRWLTVISGLAAGVILGTFLSLKLTGQAQNYTKTVLDCHEESGKVFHVHNDDCFDENGARACLLEELSPHEHDEACYTEVRVLICEKTEGEPDPDLLPESSEALADELPAETEDAAEAEPLEESNVSEEAEVSEEILASEESKASEEAEASDEADASEENRILEENREEGGTPDAEETSETGEAEPGAPQELNAAGEEQTAETGSDEEPDAEPEADEATAAEPEADEVIAAEETSAEETTAEEIPVHIHTDDCYEIQRVLVCETEERIPHTHDEACHGEEGSLICEKPEMDWHVHGAECLKEVELTPDEIVLLELEKGSEESETETEEASSETGSPKENPGETDPEEETEITEDAEESVPEERTAESYEDASREDTEETGPEEAAEKADETVLEEASENKDETASDESSDNADETAPDEAAESPEDVSDTEKPDEEPAEDPSEETVFEKNWEDEEIRILALFTNKAGIPEEAELIAERIGSQEFQPVYEDPERPYGKNLLCLKIGFFLEDEPVTIQDTVEYRILVKNKEGLVSGNAVTVLKQLADGTIEEVHKTELDQELSAAFKAE